MTQTKLLIIKAKLILIEYSEINEDKKDHLKIEAAKVIKSLLAQIDSNGEEIPFENSEKLIKNLESTKGVVLTEEESKLMLELLKK